MPPERSICGRRAIVKAVEICFFVNGEREEYSPYFMHRVRKAR